MDLANYRSASLFYAAKSRAKKKKLEFTITREWVYKKLLSGTCEVTNFVLVLTSIGEVKATKKTNPYAPSLDRKDSSLGYTPDNTQIVINAVNKFKSDMKQFEMIDIAKAILDKHISKRQFITT